MIAADEGHSEIAKLLINAGSNINAKSSVDIVLPIINITSSGREGEYIDIVYESDERITDSKVTDYTDFQLMAFFFELVIE
jgi:ankyrin repeat protein